MICERYEAHQWEAWVSIATAEDPDHWTRRCTRCGTTEHRWA